MAQRRRFTPSISAPASALPPLGSMGGESGEVGEEAGMGPSISSGPLYGQRVHDQSASGPANEMTGLQQRHMQSLTRDEHRRGKERLRRGEEKAEPDLGIEDDIGSTLEKAGAGNISKDPVFLYSGVLGAALLPPFLVMLAFGGKPTMLMLCIGGLAAHIFDIMGSVEATVFTLAITFVSMWITLVYSARHILQVSLLNFHLLAIMGLLLLFTFLLCTAAFRSARREFDTGFWLFEIMAFATLPLFSASLLTWCICVEVPEFPLPAVFTLTYYLYAYVLASPRISSDAVSRAAKHGSIEGLLHNKNFTLPTVALRLVVVFLPVLMVPVLYMSMYRPSLSRTFSDPQNMTLDRLNGFLLSVIGPLLLSCVLAEHTFDAYFRDLYVAAQHFTARAGAAAVGGGDNQGSRAPSLTVSRVMLGSVVHGLEAVKLAGAMMVFLCIESNPVFSDLKDHSGLDRGKSALVMASIGVLVGMVMVQHRRAQTVAGRGSKAGAAHDDDDKYGAHGGSSAFTGGLTVDDNRSFSKKLHTGVLDLLNGPFLPRTFTTLAISGAACMTALLLRLPSRSYPLVVMSTLSLAEYYQRWRHIDTAKITSRNAVKGWLTYLVLQVIVITAAVGLALCAYIFCEEVLLHLEFLFLWREDTDEPTDGFISSTPLVDDYLAYEDVYKRSRRPPPLAVSIQSFCHFFCFLVGIGVLLPTLALPGREHGASTTSTSSTASTAGGHTKGSARAYDPSTSSLGSAVSAPVLHKQLWHQIQRLASRAAAASASTASVGRWASGQPQVPFTLANLLFCTIFFLVNAAVVVIELLIREQDWAEYGLTAALAYPVEVFSLTSLLMAAVSYHLINIEVLPRDAALCVLEIHAAKMLHFWGLPSQGVFASIFLLVAVTVPFTGTGEDDLVAAKPDPVALARGMPNQAEGAGAGAGAGAGGDIGVSSTSSPAKLRPVDAEDHFGVVLHIVMASLSLVFARRHLLPRVLLPLLGKTATSLQLNASCVAIFSFFVAGLAQTAYLRVPSAAGRASPAAAGHRWKRVSIAFEKNINRVQTLLCMLGVIATLLTLEAFGPLTMRLDRASSTFLVIERQADLVSGVSRTDQSGLFLIITAMLALLGAAEVVPISTSSTWLYIYTLMTIYCGAQFLLWWTFPHSLGKADNSYGLLSLPSVYCYATATFTTLVCLLLFLAHLPSVKLRKLGLGNILAITRGPSSAEGALGWLFGSSSSSSMYRSAAATPLLGAHSVILATSCVFFSLPLPALVWEYAKSSFRHSADGVLAVLSHKHSYGIYWTALVSNVILCVTLRLSSLVRDVHVARAGASTSGSSSSGVNPAALSALLSTTSSLCAIASIMTTIWTIIATIHAPVGHLDPMLSVPASTLVFLTTRRGVLIDRAPALLVSAVVSAAWWLVLAMNALLIEGVGEEPLPPDLTPTFGLFSDAVISVWRAQAWWIPALNALLLLMAVPAIYSGLVRHKNDNDDAIFVYTLFAVVPLVAAQTASIRYLGLCGLLVGLWRCVEIGTARKRGNTLI